MIETDLKVRAKECGGVVAALISDLRKVPSKGSLKILYVPEQEKELNDSLRVLEKYGLIKIEERGEGYVIISKTR